MHAFTFMYRPTVENGNCLFDSKVIDIEKTSMPPLSPVEQLLKIFILNTD